MLVLRRKAGEAIVLNGTITIHVLAVEGERVKLGINAPPEVVIVRSELLEGQSSGPASSLPGAPIPPREPRPYTYRDPNGQRPYREPEETTNNSSGETPAPGRPPAGGMSGGVSVACMAGQRDIRHAAVCTTIRLPHRRRRSPIRTHATVESPRFVWSLGIICPSGIISPAGGFLCRVCRDRSRRNPRDVVIGGAVTANPDLASRPQRQPKGNALRRGQLIERIEVLLCLVAHDCVRARARKPD